MLSWKRGGQALNRMPLLETSLSLGEQQRRSLKPWRQGQSSASRPGGFIESKQRRIAWGRRECGIRTHQREFGRVGGGRWGIQRIHRLRRGPIYFVTSRNLTEIGINEDRSRRLVCAFVEDLGSEVNTTVQPCQKSLASGRTRRETQSSKFSITPMDQSRPYLCINESRI